MQSWLIDIEVFPNLFFLSIKDYKKKELFSFEVSPRKDDRQNLFNVLSKYDGYLVSFNGIHYDEMVIKFFIKEYKQHLKNIDVVTFLSKIKKFSDLCIDQERYWDEIKWYKWWKGTKWTSIDLFLYWSKMLRLSKKISLKSLAIQLNWEEIQELPYPPDKTLTNEEIEEVIRYNQVNDLGVTEKLFEKMREDILIRKYIQNTYELECWSDDAPKIAGEILIKDYCEKTYPFKHKNLIIQDEEWVEGYKTFEEYVREFKQTRHTPFYGKIKDVMDGFDVDFKIPIFQDLKKKMWESNRDFKYEFPLIYENTALKMSYGIGGLHSLQENKYYKSDENNIIVTSDYASLYPNIIINWKCIRYPETLEQYTQIKTDRIEAKSKKDKKKDTVLKLCLNSASGLLDNVHSPLYYPEGALRMRIIGQLILSKTIEVVMLNGWEVISANTDGIECVIPKSDYDKYVEVLKEVEKLFNIDLEHDKYKFIAYSNVNNYVAETKDGKIKKKGFFKYHDDIPLGDSVNEQIVPIALENYFVKGIPVEETIRNPWKYGIHIYDYCVSKKIAKGSYDVYYFGEKVQNLNRYYFAKPAPLLMKKKHTKKVREHVHKGQGVQLFNKFEEKPWEEYNIDYAYYTAKANKIINEIQTDLRQLKLF